MSMKDVERVISEGSLQPESYQGILVDYMGEFRSMPTIPSNNPGAWVSPNGRETYTLPTVEFDGKDIFICYQKPDQFGVASAIIVVEQKIAAEIITDDYSRTCTIYYKEFKQALSTDLLNALTTTIDQYSTELRKQAGNKYIDVRVETV